MPRQQTLTWSWTSHQAHWGYTAVVDILARTLAVSAGEEPHGTMPGHGLGGAGYVESLEEFLAQGGHVRGAYECPDEIEAIIVKAAKNILGT